MKILFCSSEVVPFSKTGGLADVSGALPVALEELGVEVRVATPLYKSKGKKPIPAKMGRNIKVHFIESDVYFSREGLYGDKGGDYPDNLERFAYFCKETLEVIKKDNFRPDIIHCNDWQSALIPVYLKTKYRDDAFFEGAKVLFTIHNLGYQGLFPFDKWHATGLPGQFFNIEGLEFYGKINLLKGGLVFSDALSTVSETYSREIQQAEFGCGLEGLLSKRAHDLFGIINGIDYDVWNPENDKNIFANYSKDNLEAKRLNKAGLQKGGGLELNLDAPLIGFISRLADQKGADLIAEIIDDIFYSGAQFVLLGTGDERYHRLFEGLKREYPTLCFINLKFDAVLAQKIYAGADFLLMPSRYEPCGLGQMIALRYGTIPIVRKTGGLADTIDDANEDLTGGNGFVFEDYSARALLWAIGRAIDAFGNKRSWGKFVRRAMGCDFSWQASARKYVALYKQMICSI